MERQTHTRSSLDTVFASMGEAGEPYSAMDWSKTALGPIDRWPQSLRTAVSIVLTSRHPLWLGWGPDLAIVYNQAFSVILADKHPAKLGVPVREVWPEVWHIIGPMLEGVMAGGQATWQDDQLLPLDRNGIVEEAYFTYSYSPVQDESGSIAGVFTAVQETTDEVIGARHLRTLRDLAAVAATVRPSEDTALRAAFEALAGNPQDLPFVAGYLTPESGESFLIATQPQTWEPPSSGWPVQVVADSGELALIPLEGTYPSGPWGTPPERAAVIPLGSGQGRRGALVVGLSPHRLFDDSYRGFLELVAGNIGSAMASARAYAEERRRAEALAELDRAKTAFFSNMSHEFRTPLTLMLGPLEDEMKDPSGAGTPNRARIELAHRNAIRLMKLVNNLLEFSRIEAGRVEAIFEPVDLGTVTVELVSAFRAAFERAGLALEIEIEPLAEPVYINREMWEKVIFNLLSNALKFTFEGGVEVTVRSSGSEAEVTVTDTGTGIPPEELPRLFERFHRIRGARSRTHEGTGIGLALVDELVRLHGGTVEVASTVGEGTRFGIWVPFGQRDIPSDRVVKTGRSAVAGATPYVTEALGWMSEAEEAAPILAGPDLDASAELAGSTAGAEILVADDNSDMRGYLERLLSTNWRVRVVADGQQALEAIRVRAPDLVLTDVMMPVLDGMGLLRALRADPATASIPVVMLSARAGGEAAVEGLEAGADDYLIKPFSALELTARIRSNIELARMRSLVSEHLEAAERVRHLGLMQAAAQALSATLELDGVVSQVVRWASAIVTPPGLPARRATLLRVLGEHAVMVAEYDEEGLQMRNRSFEFASHATMAEIVLNGRAQAFELDEMTLSAETRATLEGVHSVALAPVGPVGSRFGVINVLARDSAGFDDDQVARLATLANMAELAIRNAEHLDEARHEANQAVALEQAKTRLLNLAAHELRSPLTVVRGYLSMIEEGMLENISPERRTEVLSALSAKGLQMDMIVTQMLEAARLEGGRLELAMAEFDLRPVVAEVVEAARPLGAAGQVLTVVGGESRVPVMADEERIGSIVRNLVDNAIRYSPEGGEITVTVSAEGGRAKVAVADHGLGIAPQDMPTLFTRFGRVLTRQNSHISGTGLGLYLSRETARMHGGDITVSSVQGVGSTFTLELPLPGG